MSPIRNLPFAGLTLLAACTSVPREVVTITRTIQDYSAQLGETHLQTARLYRDRIERLNAAWHERSLQECGQYQADQELLVQRLEQLENTYARVAAALDEILRADPSLPRAAMFDRDEALQLAVLMMIEEDRAADSSLGLPPANSRGLREASLRSKSALAVSARELASENARLYATLERRIKTEYQDVDQSFEDLIAFFRAGLRTRSERKRLLRESQQSANRLEQEARAAKPLLRGSALDGAFDRSLEGLDALD